MSLLSNLKISARLYVGFALILVLTLGIGLLGDATDDRLTELTVKLYRHPFTVTNALQEANTNIVAMHRSMKDVALASNPEELVKAVADVDAREKKVYEKFALVRERFLGDKSDVEAAAKAFADWKPIRDQVIAAIRDGRREDAATITKTLGANQVAQVNATLTKVIAFSFDKAEAFMKNAEAVSHQAELYTRIAMAAAVVLGLLIAWLVGGSITKPVNAMTRVMGDLAANNLPVQVPHADRRDEIGLMAKAVEHFKNQLVRVKQLEGEQEAQKARSEAERKAALRQLASTFEDSVGKVIETVTSAATELQASSSQMAGTASETSAQASTVASASQQASANVETVAAATEELSSSISEIARQVERSQSVAARAEQEAQSTTDQVRALSENAAKIGEVVNLINDIAAQTNLLALNATKFRSIKQVQSSPCRTPLSLAA
ncbi:hypothetical protein A6A04_16000 [Paramagnetospirillum marisnigri]|uniref:Chemotaxis protein n=1 Tax=Paramagnetospirillum marisnigri TaxID=1285242 RepID=A0A178MT67_9PROT|nr:methyl-accepting chemotaxis protein [Paramagnetospirillum marisnigri]OAN51422.1 hypothetical protein A6A04_16000 [Paramagnetospirillum marisnigri]